MTTTSNNYFELFKIDVAFDIDKKVLHQRYISLQKESHPDVKGGSDDLSALYSHAYHILKSDVSRAEHILSLLEVDLDSIKILPEFLQYVLDLSEKIDGGSEEVLISINECISNVLSDLRVSFITPHYDIFAIKAIELKYLVNLQYRITHEL